ncbi:MAG: triacylglycerol lipase [Actinomycetota bacterium]|nr:triacylglycerol lipase [Actinomycetota bacterium]
MFEVFDARRASADDLAVPTGRTVRRSRRRMMMAASMAAPMLLLAACTSTGSGGGSGGSTPGVGPYAAATEGNGPNGSFYQIPSAPAGALPGQLLYYVPANSSQLPNADAWTVAYVSTDAQGNPDVVTGTVVVPTAKWTGSGPRPVVDYAVGTQGLGPQCAPSKLLQNGVEYEDPDITTALGKGYAVVLTDYQWAGQANLVQPYVVGLSEGHAVLDMARVGAQIPGAGLSLSAPTVVWGYSQGGGAAAEAGELWKSYQPGIDLVGVAAGGVPGNLVKVGIALNGSLGSAFLADAIVGFHSAYPSLPYSSLINAAGLKAMATLETECIVSQMTSFAFQNISTYTVGGLTIQQLLAEGNWTPTLQANSPGLAGAHIPVPTYMYRGVIDEIIPTTVEDSTYANMCATGTVIQSATYAGEHLLSDFEAESNVMTFIGQRLSGATPVNSCTTNPNSL